MSEGFLGYYAYAATVGLLVLGFFGMMMKRHLVKQLIGMNIMQTAVILFYIVVSSKWGATVPILEHGATEHAVEPSHFVNPLPHALMLTAIVVSVATTGVGLSLLLLIKKRFGSLEEPEVLERSQ
jgi:multicomponent Na+:H+ antiporter subunit C